jgi:four helix bundle protein
MDFIYESDNVLLNKTLNFAARIVKLERYLKDQKNEYTISKQILRSATSIGANAYESVYGISRADFNSKLHISLKETAETEYWIKLLCLSEYISEKEGKSLLDDCIEIKKILISTLNTSKQND